MHTKLLDRGVLVVWSVLLLAQPLGWVISHSVSAATSFTAATLADVAILLIAVAKARFIAFYFMDLRNAPVSLRAAAEGYFLLTAISMLAVYLT